MKMKSFLALATLCFSFIFGLSFSSNAQTRPLKSRSSSSRPFSRIDTLERKGVFISYPTNFIASTLKVGYEFKVANSKGLKLIGTLGSAENNSDWYQLNKFTEIGMEAQLRFYVLKEKPTLNGFYLAPYASYKSMSYSGNLITYNSNTGSYTTEQNATVSDIAVGYIIGYQWIFNSTFTIDAFIGGGYNSISGDNTQGTLGSDIYAYRNGIGIHTGLGIGIAF